MKTCILPCIVIALSAFTSLHALAIGESDPSDPGFVAHEWGTFTSVQGADGVQMDWSPLVAPELPAFVYDLFHVLGRTRTGIPQVNLATKGAIVCTQRLETPVIYFYSDRARTLDVGVDFPGGNFTEWYPFARPEDFKMFPKLRDSAPANRADLHWRNVTLLPSSNAQPIPPSSDRPGSHYYAARDTDSTLLRVSDSGKGPEIEKFLFYRGVGQFQAPLTVKLEKGPARRVTLTNMGNLELTNLFLYEVYGAGGAWVKTASLPPGQSCTVDLPANASNGTLENLPKALCETLVHEGLFDREAAAMVATWQSSWFSEKGLRVLYTLPRPWTDGVLPVHITPAPSHMERVMVGRAEIITPEMERALLLATVRYVGATPANRPAIVAETRALGLGRFLEPTLRRIMSSAPRTPQFSALSYDLLHAVINLNKSHPPTTSQN